MKDKCYYVLQFLRNMEGVFYFWTLQFVKHLIIVIDLLGDLVFSWSFTQGSKQERSLSERYQHSAHVVNVIAWARYGKIIAPGKSNFIWWHNSYINPNEILQKKSFFIFGADKDQAVFAVIDPGINIYDTRKHPFIYVDFFHHVRHLIFVPLKHFHRLAEEVGPPKVPVQSLQ